MSLSSLQHQRENLIAPQEIYAQEEHKRYGISPNVEVLQQLFREEGQSFELKGNQPLLLTNDREVCFVEKGPVDIFSVRFKDGQTVGSRKHIMRLETGRIMLGVNSEQHGKERGLIAIGSIGSRVITLEAVKVHKLIGGGTALAEMLEKAIDEWVTVLCMSLKRGVPPKDCVKIAREKENHLKADAAYQTAGGLVWIKHSSGNSLFMGNKKYPEIDGEAYFPLCENAWMVTSSAVTLHHKQTTQITKYQAFWEVLEHFHLFVLDCLHRDEQQRMLAETARLKQKAADERISLKSALGKLISVVKSGGVSGEVTADPLLSACNEIGTHLGIRFKAHPETKNGRTSLEDIARASGVRVRQVILKGAWWSQDNGPLLAYTEEEKAPVVLLPLSSRRYVLYEPLSGARTLVTEKNAETLEGLAYTFYTPFPNKALCGRDIVRLGCRGIGKDVSVIILMGILGALLGLITPVATGIIFNSVIPGAAMSQLWQIGVILIACAIGTAVFEITKSIAMLRIEGKADLNLQSAVMDRLLALPTTFFKKYTAGDLARRTLGINAMRQIVAGVTARSLLSGIFSLFYMGLLFYYSWYLTLFALGISLITIFVTVILGGLYIRYELPISEIEGKISGMVLQLINGISKLRTTGTEERAFACWAECFSRQRKLNFKSRQMQNILETCNAILPVLASLIIFYVVRQEILNPNTEVLSIGDFMAFFSAYGMLQVLLLDMSSAFVNSLSIVPYYRRLQPILQTLPELTSAKAYPGLLSGNIEISQVNFRYKADGPLILKDVSMQMHNGEFIAIVGGSGSGKSTLMRLLLGFESPAAGTIYYDGQDLAKLDILEVRRQMGVVLQTSQIMAGSIYDNIAGAGSATLTLDDAWEAARMAGCYEDIKMMPMQMHTMLPPGGGSLSGGQRQRILIARAIINKPRILFFDEATSALDNKTQAIVSESIEQLQSTRIVIAHRLSTIMHADKIYVMDKGRIVQCGAYEELLQQEGIFMELARRQMA